MIEFVPFLFVSIAIILTPGPDVALVTRNSIKGGRREGLLTSFGIFLGVLVWAMASASGVSLVLEESSYAFSVVRMAGVAFLVFLGVRILLGLKKKAWNKPEVQIQKYAVLGRVDSPVIQGALNNILNPKMAILFVSLLPQFITSGSGQLFASFELALLFDVIALTWLFIFTVAVATGKRFLKSRKIQNSFEAVSGIAIVSLGLTMALRSG